MKSNKNLKVILIIFGLIFVVNLNSFHNFEINNKNAREIEKKNITLKSSIILDEIVILGNEDWIDLINNGICSGSGDYGDPYVLENLIVDAGGLGNCLRIKNSDVYFKIINCTFLNSNLFQFTVNMENVKNGVLINNNCSFGHVGINLYNCSNNIVMGNLLNNNSQGISLTRSYNNTIMNNIAKNNSHYGIYTYKSDNNTISGNILSYNQEGICVVSPSDNNKILRNEANYNMLGILLSGDNNIVSRNYIYNNSYIGIQLTGDNNIISRNYIYNNSDNARDVSNNNFWNSSIIGNYWDDYSGQDINKDGIGDNPYSITQWSKDFLPIHGTPFHNGSKIHINDVGDGGHTWKWVSTRAWCSGTGTYKDPYVINDLVIDGEYDGTCILIENSTVYFQIKNCEVKNSGVNIYDAGIKMNNTKNGKLVNNNCSFNNNGIYLYNCNDTIISKNTVKNGSKYGIYLEYSDYNRFLNNTVINNSKGVYIANSNYNNFSLNFLTKNIHYGINISINCKKNLFYFNYFIKNGIHSFDESNINDWNCSIIGNYWDNYTGVDDNDDGVGETPYDVPPVGGSVDNYPICEDGDDLPPIINFLTPLNESLVLSPFDITVEIIDPSIPLPGNVIATIFNGTITPFNLTMTKIGATNHWIVKWVNLTTHYLPGEYYINITAIDGSPNRNKNSTGYLNITYVLPTESGIVNVRSDDDGDDGGDNGVSGVLIIIIIIGVSIGAVFSVIIVVLLKKGVFMTFRSALT